MADPNATIGMLRFVQCGVGDESYGLDMLWVRGIQRTDQMRCDPGQGDLAGWLPGRDGDIPVFSLAHRFGRSSQSAKAEGRIIILNPPLSSSTFPSPPSQRGGRPWALLVDRVSRVSQISMDRVVPLPPVIVNPSANYFQGVIHQDDQLILLLSPDTLHPDAQLPVVHPTQKKKSAFHLLAAPPSGPTTPEDAPAAAQTNRQILVFSTAEIPPGQRVLSFALSISQVLEILGTMPLTPVPTAPSFVLGLANWRERPVPVLNLNARIGLAAPPLTGASARLLVAREKTTGGEALVGFLIRPTVRTLRLPFAYKPCNKVPPLDKTCLKTIVELENETLAIPDIQGILDWI